MLFIRGIGVIQSAKTDSVQGNPNARRFGCAAPSSAFLAGYAAARWGGMMLEWKNNRQGSLIGTMPQNGYHVILPYLT
jgi:hypothetical protein